MPKLSDVPKKLKPYLFHGLDLQWGNSSQAQGECPWCSSSKFYVDVETGKWSCKRCAQGSKKGGGNDLTFLRMLWASSEKGTSTKDLEELAADRGLCDFTTLVRWDVVRSCLTNEWLVPGYSADGGLVQLYRYVKSAKDDKMLLLATPTMSHGLFGVPLIKSDAGAVCLCEGPWDGMALWERLGLCKSVNDRLVPTANPNKSMLASTNVLAVPGCSTFHDRWMPLFTGCIVNLLYDNDHPRNHPKTDKPIPPAGYNAMRRVASILSGAGKPPTEINYLRWGEDGYNLDLPTGMDVRDFING